MLDLVDDGPIKAADKTARITGHGQQRQRIIEGKDKRAVVPHKA